MRASELGIIKYIPLQQGLRRPPLNETACPSCIIKYIPLQQGLRLLPLHDLKL